MAESPSRGSAGPSVWNVTRGSGGLKRPAQPADNVTMSNTAKRRMIRRLSAVAVVALALGGAGCGQSQHSDATGETQQMEQSIATRAGGTARCVRLEDGDRYECVATTPAGQQLVDVDCGEQDCVYSARP